jgi:hypothetical protein
MSRQADLLGSLSFVRGPCKGCSAPKISNGATTHTDLALLRAAESKCIYLKIWALVTLSMQFNLTSINVLFALSQSHPNYRFHIFYLSLVFLSYIKHVYVGKKRGNPKCNTKM